MAVSEPSTVKGRIEASCDSEVFAGLAVASPDCRETHRKKQASATKQTPVQGMVTILSCLQAHEKGQAEWYTLLIPGLGRDRLISASQGQPGLHSEFQAIQNYIMRPCLKKCMCEKKSIRQYLVEQEHHLNLIVKANSS